LAINVNLPPILSISRVPVCGSSLPFGDITVWLAGACPACVVVESDCRSPGRLDVDLDNPEDFRHAADFVSPNLQHVGRSHV
jgi:hypothetical protein